MSYAELMERQRQEIAADTRAAGWMVLTRFLTIPALALGPGLAAWLFGVGEGFGPAGGILLGGLLGVGLGMLFSSWFLGEE